MTGPHPSLDLGKGLGLAAAPTFAAMAVLTGLAGSGPMDAMCMSGHGPLLGGMVPMYLLMSAFHLPPWLRLAATWRDRQAAAA